ncbi:Transcriptional regulator, TrmB family (plasmid) [Halalkaliarchaeum sp. AArc-CO]|nr:Transcriptional regulator, TrmB family [Halalkaliarchaeum sp. AArc-CO]
MPISKDEFRSIDEDGPSLPDLAPDTTQGAVYRFLLEHAYASISSSFVRRTWRRVTVGSLRGENMSGLDGGTHS